MTLHSIVLVRKTLARHWCGAAEMVKCGISKITIELTLTIVRGASEYGTVRFMVQLIPFMDR